MWYKYRVNFNTYVRDISYVRFTDGEPDTYSCGQMVTGNHYIDYNSKAPTIEKVIID